MRVLARLGGEGRFGWLLRIGRVWLHLWENAPCRRQQGLPLNSAGAISDMVSEERVAEPVEFPKAFRCGVRCRDQWQRGATRLAEAAAAIADQIFPTGNLAVFPR